MMIINSCPQAIRAQQDEQVRLKDIEVNELKSLKLDLDKELRDCKMVIERVGDGLLLYPPYGLVVVTPRPPLRPQRFHRSHDNFSL